MKRFLSLLLVLCTFLSLFPAILPIAAEEALPKDETKGNSTTLLSESGTGMTAYDSLYIGADGSTTAYGGKLIGLYTAFTANDASVTLASGTAAGVWKNKMDITGSTNATLRDTYANVDWTFGAEGGVGYELTAAQWKNATTLMGITLPSAWAELSNFTVEQTSLLDAIDNGGVVLSNQHSAIRLDLLLATWLPSDAGSVSEVYKFRWTVGVTQTWGGIFEDTTHRDFYYANQNTPLPITMRLYKETGTQYVKFGLQYANGNTYDKADAFTLDSYAAAKQSIKDGTAKNARPIFSLFNGMPGDIYALRVYDSALTRAEFEHNACIDLLAYAGVDVAEYTALDASLRAIVDSFMARFGFHNEKTAIGEAFRSLVNIQGEGVAPEDTFYVTDGLVLLLASYRGLDTGSYIAAAHGGWYNAVTQEQEATLKGYGWYKDPVTGGLTVHRTREEYLSNSTFGVYLPKAALPAEDYTLEFVANPVGITTVNENGERERHIDTVTATGTHNEYGIGIGALRCLQFACYRPAGKDGQMERRWCYNATGGLASLGWKYRISDVAWENLAYDAVVSYRITHDYEASTSSYVFYDCEQSLSELSIGSDEYKTTAEAGNMFQLMVGVAGSVFAVRMYDRVLSDREMAQNHAADVIYFYDLDTTMVEKYIAAGMSKEDLLQQVATLDFSMSAEEAQKRFDACIAYAWVQYAGIGIRNDGTDGVRYYFTIDEAALTKLMSYGFTVEYGAIANVGKDSAPLYAEHDHKIVAYENGTKNTGFFVNDNTFALTALYSSNDRSTMHTVLLVEGYLRLVDGNGAEMIMQIPVYTDTFYPNSLFSVYFNMRENEKVKEAPIVLEHVETAVRYCYDDIVVHVQAGAAAGGDGSIGAPYHSFADGFAKCKEILAKANTPCYVSLLLGDGEYGVYETQTLTAADTPYEYAYFEISSENGNSTLTTTKNIDSAFTKYANNIWVTQLDKDENGEYPCFRYLYVDGVMADLAYSGNRFSFDEIRYLNRYAREYDAIFEKAKAEETAGTLTEDSASDYPSSRPDLIAAFNGYKYRLLALAEANAQKTAGTLTIDSTSSYTHADTLTYYEEYKLQLLALDELETRYTALTDTASNNEAAFKAFVPTSNTENEAYAAVFIALRDAIYAEGSYTFTSFSSIVSVDARDDAKSYVNIAVVGDLTAAIAEGKARNQAAYEALLAVYNAASAEEKAEMAEALSLAKKKVEDATWRRYALEGTGLEMNHNGQWWHNMIHATGVDYDDFVVDDYGETHVAVYFEKDEYDSFFIHGTYDMRGRYVYMKGALAYVDSEGEYYYDEMAGKLYYYSEGDVSGKTFARGTNDYMFVLSGAQNVTFSGLHITGIDDAYLSHNDGCNSLDNGGATGIPIGEFDRYPVYDRSAILINSGQDIVVRGCDFDELGARAIFARDIVKNVIIEYNSFVRLGGGGIHFGDGTLQRTYKKDVSEFENITVTNNYFYDMGREYRTGAGIFINFGRNLTITHNTLKRCAYTAIGVGFTYSTSGIYPTGEAYHMTNVEIAHNYISDFMHEIGDGGAIYVTGACATIGYTDYFNFLHHNYIVMTNITGNGLGHMICGIYFDGATSNWHCYENVIAEQSYGAVAGEDDARYAAGDRYVTQLRKRRTGTTYIYLQHINGQETYNILCEDNYILNVRATTADSQQTEVYRTYVVAERNLVEKDTHYVRGVTVIPAAAEIIAANAGAFGHKGNTDLLRNNDY